MIFDTCILWQMVGRPQEKPSASVAGDVVLTPILTPGDVLFVPRGMPHYAKSVADHPSLHFTVSPVRFHFLLLCTDLKSTMIQSLQYHLILCVRSFVCLFVCVIVKLLAFKRFVKVIVTMLRFVIFERVMSILCTV